MKDKESVFFNVALAGFVVAVSLLFILIIKVIVR